MFGAEFGQSFIGIPQLLKSCHDGVYHVSRIIGSEGLRQYVVDTCRFHDGTHGATSDYSGSRRGWLQHYPASTEAPQNFMGESTINQGNSNQCFTRFLYALANGFGHFARFSKTHAHQSVPVANDHQSAETEAPTALHHLGDAIDVDNAIVKVVIVWIDS